MTLSRKRLSRNAQKDTCWWTSASYFHILRSKTKGSGSLKTRAPKSGCSGFSRRFRSWGMTTDGTSQPTVRPATNQLKPMSCSTVGKGRACQSGGSCSGFKVSTLIRSGRSTRIERRSVGASPGLRLTKYSSAARERLEEAYATRVPRALQRPPTRREPSPSNAAEGGCE